MENSYGIGVTNKYSVFLDDDGADPFEALENASKKEHEEKKVKASGKENKSTSKTSSNKAVKASAKDKAPERDSRPAANSNAVGRGTGPRRGGFAGENREERNNRRNYDDRPDFREGGAPPRFGGGEGGMERGRGRGRGRGGERGRGRGRGGGGLDNRGKREFDRQSGSDRSGVKAVDKRDGSGRGNWGTVQDDIAALEAPSLDDSAAAEPEAAETGGGEGTADAAPAVDEGPKELTLDEWKKQQEPRAQPKFNVRRAGEGENTAQWKGTYELKKKKNEDYESEDEDESDEEEEHVRHGRPRNFVTDIQFTFSDNRRGRGGGRGGRGGFRDGEGGGFRGGYRGRGRGGYGGEEGGYRPSREGGEEGGFRGSYRGRGGRGGTPRGGAQRQHAPKVDDEKDFPSLG